jgi:hypothetical protein
VTTIRLRGWDGASDQGTEETRLVTIEAQPDHLTIHLESEGEQPGDSAAVWVQWKPGIGWEVMVHQKHDEFSKSLVVPDNGEPITTIRD